MNKTSPSNQAALQQRSPLFLAVLLLGLAATLAACWLIRQEIIGQHAARFEQGATRNIDAIAGRVETYIAMLRGGVGLFNAIGEPTAEEFAAFAESLKLKTEYPGIRGIGYSKRLTPEQVGQLEATQRENGRSDFRVWPEASDAQIRHSIVYLEPPDARNLAAIGYDMFSEATRREAMQRAMETGTETASGPVELVQEITSVKQVGFLVYLPYRNDGDAVAAGNMPDGFVYAPFRAGDLHAAALEKPPVLPVVIKTYDISGPDPVEIYRTPAYDELRSPDGMTTSIDVNVAGRKWRYEIHSTGGVAQYADFLPVYALCAVLIVLAASLAAGARWQHKAVESAVALHENTHRSLEEKELLVQEMRHRIKNSISRMMAIARQTASSSDSLEDFSTSFTARMNAMAKAQDLLSRSHWGRADLADLIKTELGQVFGDQSEHSHVDGPTINLNERATQALGLVFHELATNALKYSGVADGNAELSVVWRYEGKGAKRSLVLVWLEKGNKIETEPTGKGFGSRLVEASIRGELGGAIERDFGADGMSVSFTIPAKSIN